MSSIRRFYAAVGSTMLSASHTQKLTKFSLFSDHFLPPFPSQMTSTSKNLASKLAGRPLSDASLHLARLPDWPTKTEGPDVNSECISTALAGTPARDRNLNRHRIGFL